MRGTVAKKLRRACRLATRESSGRKIKVVRTFDGGQAGMIVCTGYRAVYLEAKKNYKEVVRA